ncbi:hypothetical protein H8B21_19655 [Sphingobacterium chuzhouense]|uniref:Iron uptake protein n=1 Tax=Sphingobacterium chuzhouense TaxID=1742264 RepID=A0ABR7XXJ6_9SPHI|nr:hypothetical protein [Sphingobacterium chuzhouense]
MPANKKYLSSPFQRFLKITGGFVGGYVVMVSFHLMLTCIFTDQDIVITAYLSGYVLWAILLLYAFLVKNGWWIWVLYPALTTVFYLLFYFLHA